MIHKLTIELPEEVYQALLKTANKSRRAPEVIAAEWFAQAALFQGDDPRSRSVEQLPCEQPADTDPRFLAVRGGGSGGKGEKEQAGASPEGSSASATEMQDQVAPLRGAEYTGQILPGNRLQIPSLVLRDLHLRPGMPVKVVLLPVEETAEEKDRRAAERAKVDRQIADVRERLSRMDVNLTDALLHARQEEDASH